MRVKSVVQSAGGGTQPNMEIKGDIKYPRSDTSNQAQINNLSHTNIKVGTNKYRL